SVVLERLRPMADTVTGSPGIAIPLAALHVNCDGPNGPVTVAVSNGETVTLQEDPDGGGIYRGQWTPPAAGHYTLTLPNNDVVQVIPPYSYQKTTFQYRTIAGTRAVGYGLKPGFPILLGPNSFDTLWVENFGVVHSSASMNDLGPWPSAGQTV